MKTLDEVIILMEDERKCDVPMYKDDALYYLKMYRSDKAQYEADRKNWEDDLSQKLRFFDEARNKLIAKYKELDIGTLNNPLTWDELKTMEGKPVWVEYGCNFNQKRWVIIHSFHNTGSFCYMNVHGNYPNTFWQKDMGADEYWQAYRKERYELDQKAN